MSFPTMHIVQVDSKKILAIKGLIGEVRSHMAQYNMEGAEHRKYVETRLAKIEDLTDGFYGRRPDPNEYMD